MVSELRKRIPLTEYHLSFLKPYILQKRIKERSLSGKDEDDKKLETKDNTSSRAERKFPDGVSKQKESKQESPVDIAEQVKVLQEHLESLKKEKHNLFQQLKLVLHDEDEKKKQEEQKLELEKNATSGDIHDPRQQSAIGMKRPYASMLSSSYPGASPIKRQQRAPLLPTPEASSPGHFSRQSSGGSFQGTESFHQGKVIFSPRTPSDLASGRPYLDQRMGPTYMPPDVHMQVNRTSQPSGTLQSQYQSGMSVGSFQYTPGPSPYGSMTNVHGPSTPSQPMQYPHVQQHDVHAYNDISMKGHPMYGSVAGSSGHQTGEHVPAGSYPASLHDPRHPKLISEHIQSSHYSS